MTRTKSKIVTLGMSVWRNCQVKIRKEDLDEGEGVGAVVVKAIVCYILCCSNAPPLPQPPLLLLRARNSAVVIFGAILQIFSVRVQNAGFQLPSFVI